MDISKQIEAILFYKAEPVKIKKLADILDTDVRTVKSGLEKLLTDLNGRGLTLIISDDEAMLGTSRDASSVIEKLRKDELSSDLGKAALETLSIILYQGPISRTNIDYIRGVNSQFILRSLLIRGLIERVDNPEDSRSFLYKPSLELLAHLGVSRIEDLPEYQSINNEIATHRKAEIVAPEDKTRDQNGDTIKV